MRTAANRAPCPSSPTNPLRSKPSRPARHSSPPRSHFPSPLPPTAGSVKRAGSLLKIIHDKYSKNPTLLGSFLQEFDEAVKHNEALRAHFGKAQEDLNPIRVLSLFEAILKEDVDLLDLHDRRARGVGGQALRSLHGLLHASDGVQRGTTERRLHCGALG